MAEKCKLEKERMVCPFCDKEIAAASFPYCESCQTTVFYCPKCRQPVPRNKNVCPKCGAKIK